jgi:hypothetical protein
MSAKSFIAAGDVLINPALVAYATVQSDTEGVTLCLGFAGQVGGAQEIRLKGLEARSVLRWLRKNAEFLDAGGSGISPGYEATVRVDAGRPAGRCCSASDFAASRS